MTTGCTVVKELAGIQLLLHAVLCKELREKEPHLLPMDTQGNCEGQQEFLPVLPPAPQCCTGTPVSALNRKSAFQLIVLSPWAIGNCLCVEWVCMECCVWSRFVWRGVCGVVCVEWCVCRECTEVCVCIVSAHEVKAPQTDKKNNSTKNNEIDRAVKTGSRTQY